MAEGITVISGCVSHGDKRGRLLGFPTANIVIDASLDVPDGVWAGVVRLDGVARAAAVSVGVRPTYYGEGGIRLLEAHLLDFCGDLYGREIDVFLGRMLRPQHWFGGSEELVRQVHRDIEDTRRWAVRSGLRVTGPGSEVDARRQRHSRRDRRIAAAAALAVSEGRLTHEVVASLAGVPVGLLFWLHPALVDLEAVAQTNGLVERFAPGAV